MAIKLVLPADGAFTITSIQDLIDVVAEGDLTNTTSTGFNASGTLNGSPATAVATGTGLGYFFGYPVSGVLDTLTVTAGSDDILFTNMNLDIGDLASAAANDRTAEFLLGLDWDMTLGNGDDIAPKGTLIQGTPFELTGNDTIRGFGGNDNLYTGDGNDNLFGNRGRDILNGGKGADVVNGGDGNDKAIGGNGNDTMIGGKGNDKLFGNNGNDTLTGNQGNDTLFGGKGNDDFIFTNGDGNDTIKDFDATNNREDIDLSGVTRIKGFTDLKNNHMGQAGSDVIIDDGANLKIILVGVDIDDLGKADFLF